MSLLTSAGSPCTSTGCSVAVWSRRTSSPPATRTARDSGPEGPLPASTTPSLGSGLLDIEVPAGFSPGGRGPGAQPPSPRHTRLPRYTRGRRGTVIRDNGVLRAAGHRRAGPAPRRDAAARLHGPLCGAGAVGRACLGPADSVYVEMWEEYVEAQPDTGSELAGAIESARLEALPPLPRDQEGPVLLGARGRRRRSRSRSSSPRKATSPGRSGLAPWPTSCGRPRSGGSPTTGRATTTTGWPPSRRVVTAKGLTRLAPHSATARRRGRMPTATPPPRPACRAAEDRTEPAAPATQRPYLVLQPPANFRPPSIITYSPSSHGRNDASRTHMGAPPLL